MNLGEIYLWETDRAQGYVKRNKYHIFVCQDDDGNYVFMYINSADYYKDYKILRANYTFLSYDSFIGCNAVETYAPITFAMLNPPPQLKGQLTVADMKSLRDAIIAAETMTQQDANRVCKALSVVL